VQTRGAGNKLKSDERKVQDGTQCYSSLVVLHRGQSLSVVEWCADMQVKTKFWGKSMEVQPIGIVSLQLNK